MNSFEEIRAMISQRRAQEALTALDAMPLTALTEPDQQEWNRIKSDAAARLNMLELSLSLRESVALSPYANLADYFMTADIALELEQQEKALIYLSKTIATSIEQNQPWFLSACYLRRAYLHILNGDVALAMQDIQHLTDDNGPDISLPNIPPLTKKFLIDLAHERSSS